MRRGAGLLGRLGKMALFGGGGAKPWYQAGGAPAPVIYYEPVGAANQAASYVNLINPGTYDLTVGNAPGWDAINGWKFDGVNDYLKTGWIPGNGNTIIVGFTNFVAQTSTQKAIFGSINSGKFFCYYATGQYVIYGNRCAGAGFDTSLGGASSPAAGVIATVPGNVYLNGELHATTAQADQTNLEQYIGGLNNNGTRGLHAAVYVRFWLAYDQALTQAQIQKIGDYYIPSGTTIMPYGDSKSAVTTIGNWPLQLSNAVGGFPEYPYRIGVANRTVADAKAAVDSELALKRGTPDYILWNLGVNDANVFLSLTEAGWKADAQYIIDALHTKWPAAKIYFMYVWNSPHPAECATINGWYVDLIAANSGLCYAGPDESVWLENGDDGATYTADGTHYNEAGHAEAVNQWLAVLP